MRFFASFHFKSNKMQVTKKKTFQASFLSNYSQRIQITRCYEHFFLGFIFGLDGNLFIETSAREIRKKNFGLKL